MKIQRPELTGSRILIVDDDESNVLQLEHILHQADYTNTTATTDSREAMQLYRQIRPDLVIVDIHMPAPNGFDLLREIGLETAGRVFVPVVVVTEDTAPASCLRALGLGAKEFLIKPVDRLLFLMRVRNLLEMRLLYGIVREEPVSDRNRHGAEQGTEREELVTVLSRALLQRTGSPRELLPHIRDISFRIARALGLSEAAANDIALGSMLADIGKTALPAHLWPEGNGTTQKDRELRRTHTTLGAEMLSGRESSLLQTATHIAAAHHERWDGQGYPLGLKEQAIPIEARIVAVAEFFARAAELLEHPTASRKGVLGEVARQSGFRFDPAVVDALIAAESSGPVEAIP